MIQFMIVAVIVGGFTACFFGVPASLMVGRKLTEFWIMAGLLVTIMGPFFGLVRFVRDAFHRITGIFRR